MADFKKVALGVAILVMIPLFLFLFIDAIYPAPKYEDFCGRNMEFTSKPIPAACINPDSNLECTATGTSNGKQLFSCKSTSSTSNCVDAYSTPEAMKCTSDGGSPVYTTGTDCCQVFDKCEMCGKLHQDAQTIYNRNLFLILTPIGIALIVAGIYVMVEYIAAGLMFGGLITLTWATIQYFSEMSKLLRALVILAELVLITYLGYKKLSSNQKLMGTSQNSTKKKRR